jgi:hypothetical protein
MRKEFDARVDSCLSSSVLVHLGLHRRARHLARILNRDSLERDPLLSVFRANLSYLDVSRLCIKQTCCSTSQLIHNVLKFDLFLSPIHGGIVKNES